MVKARIYPGDIVVFIDDPEAEAMIVENTDPKPPDQSPFLNNADSKRLQQLWRARQFMSSRIIYLVLCASKDRAMVMHPRGQLLVTQTKFLEKLNGKPNEW